MESYLEFDCFLENEFDPNVSAGDLYVARHLIVCSKRAKTLDPKLS